MAVGPGQTQAPGCCVGVRGGAGALKGLSSKPTDSCCQDVHRAFWMWLPWKSCGMQVCNCWKPLGTPHRRCFFQDLSSWLEETAPAQDVWRSEMETSGEQSVTHTLVSKLPMLSAGSCSVAQPCPSPGELTLERGSVPSGTESCSVWGTNPSSPPAPGSPSAARPAPMRTMLVSPAHVSTWGGGVKCLPRAVRCGAGEQGSDRAEHGTGGLESL